MTRSTVVAGGQQYAVSGLEPRARGEVHQAVVTVRLVDDATGAPVAGRVRISTSVEGLVPVSASGGYVGLAGRPTRVLPRLDSTAYTVPVVVEADGFLSWRSVAAFAVQPPFPAQFVAAHFGEVRLPREAVVITVSTVELDPANRPVALPGATARLTGVWRKLADVGGAPATPLLLSLSPGLSAGRPIGATVDVPTLTLPPEPDRSLLSGTAPGATWLSVSRRGLVTAGDLVALDRTDPDRAEYVEVTTVQGSSDPEAPSRFELRHTLTRGHAALGPVLRVVTPGPPVSPATLTAVAAPGAATAEVSSLAAIVAGSVVRISGGAAPEYRIADLYELTTNADGAGHLPPLTGYVAARLTASAGALTASAKVTLTRPHPSLDLTLT